MLKSRKRLNREKERLENRVLELENILCPNGHCWEEIDNRIIYNDVILEITFRCRVCGKIEKLGGNKSVR